MVGRPPNCQLSSTFQRRVRPAEVLHDLLLNVGAATDDVYGCGGDCGDGCGGHGCTSVRAVYLMGHFTVLETATGADGTDFLALIDFTLQG